MTLNEYLITEGKNLGNLYHFCNITSAIGVVDSNRLYSTNAGVSTTRNKFLYKDKPNGVSFGVRFVFDGKRLSDDFSIVPFKFSRLWDEREELVRTVGSWNNRPKLKRHQIFDLKKYIVSIDLITEDIYKDRPAGWQDDKIELLFKGKVKDFEFWDFLQSEYGVFLNGKGYYNKNFVNLCKEWFEKKGYKVNIVGPTYNKKQYLIDKGKN